MKVFCGNCRDEVDYIVLDIVKKKELKGVGFTYNGKESYCSECNELIFVGEVHDYNLRQMNKKFN